MLGQISLHSNNSQLTLFSKFYSDVLDLLLELFCGTILLLHCGMFSAYRLNNFFVFVLCGEKILVCWTVINNLWNICLVLEYFHTIKFWLILCSLTPSWHHAGSYFLQLYAISLTLSISQLRSEKDQYLFRNSVVNVSHCSGFSVRGFWLFEWFGSTTFTLDGDIVRIR